MKQHIGGSVADALTVIPISYLIKEPGRIHWNVCRAYKRYSSFTSHLLPLMMTFGGDKHTPELLFTGVKCIQCDGRRVVSGSNDKTIRVFDLEDGRCLYAFLFPDWINCLSFDESSLVGGSSDSTLSLFSFILNDKERGRA